MTNPLTRDLIAFRTKHQGNHLVTHRVSGLINMLGVKPHDEAHAIRLRKAMDRTTREIEQVLRDGKYERPTSSLTNNQT